MAARLLSSSEALHEEIGKASVPWVAKMNDKTRTTIGSLLDHAERSSAWEEGRALTIDEAVALALDS